MFRVLSDEEARRAVRWKAPDLRTGASVDVVNRPVDRSGDKPITPIRPMHEPMPRETSTANAAVSLNLKNHKLRSVEEPETPYRPSAGRVSGSGQTALKITPGAYTIAPTQHRLEKSADQADADDDPAIAIEEAYQRGLADGQSALQGHSAAQIAAVVSELASRASDYRDAEIEREVLSLALQIGELVLRQELKVNADALYQLVQLGLEQLPLNKSAAPVVYLNPEDAALLRTCTDTGGSVHCRDEPALDRGQCRIESGPSIVHSGVDEWLSGIARQLGFDLP